MKKDKLDLQPNMPVCFNDSNGVLLHGFVRAVKKIGKITFASVELDVRSKCLTDMNGYDSIIVNLYSLRKWE